jgi:hypothetical protein
MNIIEKGTGKQMELLEKLTKSAWRKWVWLAVVIVLLVVVFLFVRFYRPVFSLLDYVFTGLFLVAFLYCLIKIYRMK